MFFSGCCYNMLSLLTHLPPQWNASHQAAIQQESISELEAPALRSILIHGVEICRTHGSTYFVLSFSTGRLERSNETRFMSVFELFRTW